MCVCVSVPLQITLGVLFFIMQVSSLLGYFGKFEYFILPTSVPIFYVLITYSRQNNILIPTYIGMSSLYQVLKGFFIILRSYVCKILGLYQVLMYVCRIY